METKMQFPNDGENVAVEYVDTWVGKPEILIAQRMGGRWIDVRTRTPLFEKKQSMRVTY